MSRLRTSLMPEWYDKGLDLAENSISARSIISDDGIFFFKSRMEYTRTYVL